MKRLVLAAIVAAASCAQAEQIAPDLFVYPNKGQTTEQQAKDRDECADFAHRETGFERTRAVAVPADIDRAAEFVLAEKDRPQAEYIHVRNACMQERGYVVR